MKAYVLGLLRWRGHEKRRLAYAQTKKEFWKSKTNKTSSKSKGFIDLRNETKTQISP
jgi:hypothetical protein